MLIHAKEIKMKILGFVGVSLLHFSTQKVNVFCISKMDLSEQKIITFGVQN
jgi:hypothetical protein